MSRRNDLRQKCVIAAFLVYAVGGGFSVASAKDCEPGVVVGYGVKSADDWSSFLVEVKSYDGVRQYYVNPALSESTKNIRWDKSIAIAASSYLTGDVVIPVIGEVGTCPSYGQTNGRLTGLQLVSDY